MITNSSLTASRARHRARDAFFYLGGTKAISIAIQEFRSVVLTLCELGKEDSHLVLSLNDFQLIFTYALEGQYPPDLDSYLKSGGAMPSLNFRISFCT
jgi:hypothetical protein